MRAEHISEILEDIRTCAPLIHCITNPISITLCANGILAVGARPIMAEHPDEVDEITASASALLLNTGNITDSRIRSIPIAAKAARKNGVPFVLDAVGASCSGLRRTFIKTLLETTPPTIIKGNYAEILALCDDSFSSSGVDTDPSLSEEDVFPAMLRLQEKTGAVILASGKKDLVTDGKIRLCVQNGTPMLSRITGTGCLLGALTACFLAVRPDIYSATAACAFLGICGELADKQEGCGSFSNRLLDALSCLKYEQIHTLLRMEATKIETV